MKSQKRTKQIAAIALVLPMLFACLFLQAYAQEDEPQNETHILWAHLYQKSDEVCLIGHTEEAYDHVMPDLEGGFVYKFFITADIVIQTEDGEESALSCNGTGYKDYFIFRLDLSSAVVNDPSRIQSMTLLFPEDCFESGAPAFAYTTDEVIGNTPVWDNTSDHTFPCTCEGNKIYARVRIEDFMFLPLGTDPQTLSDISLSFGSSEVFPTQFSYDGEALAIDRLGAISDYDQLVIDERENVIYRSFEIQYKNSSSTGRLRIEPNSTLLFQQRRVMWLYMFRGGLFKRLWTHLRNLWDIIKMYITSFLK